VDVIGITQELPLEMVEAAYRRGIFPMADPAHGIFTWHFPERRAILPLDGFHASRSLERSQRRAGFEVTFDRDFAAVMRGCAAGRPVWINEDFHRVYGALHGRGQAHSVEVWQGRRLVGGTYGVQVGGAFCAESKFHRVTDASKVALRALVDRLRERRFVVLDVQYLTAHLQRLGAIEIGAEEYLRLLRRAARLKRSFG
jgi:leucyl/phenylalanyl-tRNA--protein transferase